MNLTLKRVKACVHYEWRQITNLEAVESSRLVLVEVDRRLCLYWALMTFKWRNNNNLIQLSRGFVQISQYLDKICIDVRCNGQYSLNISCNIPHNISSNFCGQDIAKYIVIKLFNAFAMINVKWLPCHSQTGDGWHFPELALNSINYKWALILPRSYDDC